MVANLFWRSAALGLSQSFMVASSLCGRPFRFQESLGQLRVESKRHLEESYVFSAVIGVFAGSRSASVRLHPKRDLAFAVRKGCRELASEVGRVSERTRLRSSSQVHPRQVNVRFAPSRRKSVWCSSPDEDELSLALRESGTDFPAVSLQLLNPSKWRLTAYGAVVIRRDASQSLLTTDALQWTLEPCSNIAFSHCVESLRLASGQVLCYIFWCI